MARVTHRFLANPIRRLVTSVTPTDRSITPMIQPFGRLRSASLPSLGPWLGAYLVVILCGCGLACAQSDTSAASWDPPNLVTIDPDHPPPNRLTASELERLSALRNIQEINIGVLSADGATLWGSIVAKDEVTPGLWDIAQGSFAPVELAEGYMLKHSAWLDADHLRLVLEHCETHDYHLGQIDRRNGQLWIQAQPLPISGDIKAISANGRRIAIATKAADTSEDGSQPPDTQPSATLADEQEIPPASDATAEDQGPLITGERVQIRVFDLDDRTPRELITLPATVSLGGISFSPDGSRLALVQNFLVNVGQPVNPATQWPILALTSLQMQDALGLIPPSENPYHINSRLLLFDLSDTNGVPRSLAATDLPEPNRQFSNLDPSWNPSGTRLVVRVNIPSTLVGRQWPIYFKPQAVAFVVLDTELGLLQTITDAPLSFPYYHDGPPTTVQTWQDDTTLLFVAIDRAETVMYRYHLATKQLSEIARGGQISQIKPLFNQTAAVMIYETVNQAPELVELNLKTGSQRPISHLNAPATQAARVDSHPVEFTLANGETCGGYWFAPAGMNWPPKRQPVVFWQHGGPGGEMIDLWGIRVEQPLTLLPSFGISVLMAPLQQRPGKPSENWNALADGENFGSIDVDALAEIAAQLVKRGWVSPRGLGITGCSYGGYLSAQSIVRHPQLWAAANPQCSLVDAISEFQNPTADGAHLAYLMGAKPWQQWAHYIDASPGFHGAQVQADTLIFHGAEDSLPLSIMENFFSDINEAGLAKVRMLRFLEEPHGLTQAGSQLYAAQEQILWFREHLK